METFTKKRCSKCHDPKSVQEFWPDRHSKDGLFHRCKACCKIVQAEFREKNREKIRARKHADYIKNRDHILSLQNAWRKSHQESVSKSNRKQYQKNRENRLAYQTNYAEIHKEKILKYLRNYRIIHHERLSESARQWRADNPNHPRMKVFRFKAWALRNPEKYRVCRKTWLKAHPEYSTKWNLLRRARKNNALILDSFHIEEIAERDNWRCHICRGKVTRKNWSIDHHFPLGLPDAIHGRQYVSLAHQRCNSKRGTGRLPVQLRLLP